MFLKTPFILVIVMLVLQCSCHNPKKNDFTVLTSLLRDSNFNFESLNTIGIRTDSTGCIVELDLSGHRIDKISNQINNLNSLTKLDITNCGVKKIPVFQSNKLRVIEASGNFVSEMPDLKNVKSLVRLNLDWNNISDTINFDYLPPMLKRLSLNRCKIRCVRFDTDFEAKSLTYLSFVDNQITSLDESLIVLNNKVKLNFDKNLINNIDSVSFGLRLNNFSLNENPLNNKDRKYSRIDRWYKEGKDRRDMNEEEVWRYFIQPNIKEDEMVW